MTSEPVDELIAALRAGLAGAQGGPYHLDKRGVYIWAPAERGGDFPIGDQIGQKDGIPVMRLRGWGYYTGNGHGALGLPSEVAEKRQRQTGEHLARCSPENIARLLDEIASLRAAREKAEAESAAKDAEIARLREALAKAATRFRNCRGAIESNQIVDKDVIGSLKRGFNEAILAARALSEEKTDG